jgi:hypothetical protein
MLKIQGLGARDSGRRTERMKSKVAGSQNGKIKGRAFDRLRMTGKGEAQKGKGKR